MSFPGRVSRAPGTFVAHRARLARRATFFMSLPPRRKPSRATPLADLVGKALDPVIAKQGFGESDIILNWDDIVGARLAGERPHPAAMAAASARSLARGAADPALWSCGSRARSRWSCSIWPR